MNYIKDTYIKDNIIYEDEFHTEVVDSLNKSGLIVAPTGSGKTVICIRLISKFAADKSKIWLIAPTNILVRQHYATLTESLKNLKIVHISSEDKDRISPCFNANVLISTPHLFYSMCNFIQPDLLLVDEAHHVNDSYPYSAVINYKGDKIGFTASPGHTKTKLNQLLKFLDTKAIFFKKEQIENIESIVEKIPLHPYILDTVNLVKELLKKINDRLYELDPSLKFISLENAIKTKPQYISLIAPAIRLKYLYLLLSSHSPLLAVKYFEKIDKKLIHICSSDKIQQLNSKLKSCMNVTNNKLEYLLKIIEMQRMDKHKGIVFASYRDTLNLLSANINNSVILVGKSGKGGRYRQQFAIEQIKENTADVVLATSIGEEGLDLPTLDYVIFYDIPSSEKRLIQRKGRTGRNKKRGKIYYLLNIQSPDIYNYQQVMRKQNKMHVLFDDDV